MENEIEIRTRIYGFLKEGEDDFLLRRLMLLKDLVMLNCIHKGFFYSDIKRLPAGEIVFTLDNPYGIEDPCGLFLGALKRKRQLHREDLHMLRDIILGMSERELEEKWTQEKINAFYKPYKGKTVKDILGQPNDPFVTAYIEAEEKDLERLKDEFAKLRNELGEAYAEFDDHKVKALEKKHRQLVAVIACVCAKIRKAKAEHKAEL